MKENVRIWVNRVFAFLFGGFLLFLIMNFGLVSHFKSLNEELKKELDECKYEANRLLNDAKAYFENKDYDKAKETLNTLFEKHPGSNETAEGKKVYIELEDTVKKEQKEQEELDKKWEAAVGGVREEWAKKMATQLREELVAEREKLEKDMDGILDREWEKMKAEIREEWEKKE
jgi:hypothetical protein